MKIGEPVDKPVKGTRAAGKYLEIEDALGSMPEGKWLPVTWDNKKEVAVARAYFRHKHFSVCTSGTTMYICKPENGAGRA